MHFFIKHHATILYNLFFIWKLGDYSRYIFFTKHYAMILYLKVGWLFTIYLRFAFYLKVGWLIIYLKK